jgi:hypothetical protein
MSLCGIRTHSFSRRAAAELRLKDCAATGAGMLMWVLRHSRGQRGQGMALTTHPHRAGVKGRVQPYLYFLCESS